MIRNYYCGFSRKFEGIGIMLAFDPPYTSVRRSWSLNFKAGWFIFWYVKEKKNRAKPVPKQTKPWGGQPLNTSKNAHS